MQRRFLLTTAISCGTLLVAGCSEGALRETETPDEGHLRIYNNAESEIVLDVRISDEESNVVYSENHSLSPENTNGDVVSESPGTAVGNTYAVVVESADFEESVEWEVTDGTGILFIEIKETGVEINQSPFED